ncbi:MAG: hypothetical protein ABI724_11845 [Betaproteobacteria bacterium]
MVRSLLSHLNDLANATPGISLCQTYTVFPSVLRIYAPGPADGAPSYRVTSNTLFPEGSPTMPNFSIPKETWIAKTLPDGRAMHLLAKDAFETFNADALGLGDLKAEAHSLDSIVAIFDLEGFTAFCKQIEPHLAVPLFLSSFLDWLMASIRGETKEKEDPDGIVMWCPLPYFVKFMGDGLLVLWDSSVMNSVARRNVVRSCERITTNYSTTFLPTIRMKVTDPPTKLRCGVARGTVFSVGSSEDYVGSCINVAARIQKISSLTFTFNRRGFDLEEPGTAEFFTDEIVVKALSIRGIGKNELIGVLKHELATLPPDEGALFRDPGPVAETAAPAPAAPAPAAAVLQIGHSRK